MSRALVALVALIAFAGLSGRAFAQCEIPPVPVVNIPGTAYYTDPTRSVRDEELFLQNREQLRALDDYLIPVARMTDNYLKGDSAAGQCALTWLTAWADGRALLGEPTTAQSRSQRRWSASSMSLSALKAWDAASESQRARMRDYFGRLVKSLEADAVVDRIRNNHLYWAGLAYGAIGTLNQNTALFDRAVGICRDAVASMTPQGSLPLEDARGTKAIDYNGFALFPLSVISVMNQGRPGCTNAELRPLANHILANRSQTTDKFLRWVPFMKMDVPLDSRVLFYSYGGGHLPLVAEHLPRITSAAR